MVTTFHLNDLFILVIRDDFLNVLKLIKQSLTLLMCGI